MLTQSQHKEQFYKQWWDKRKQESWGFDLNSLLKAREFVKRFPDNEKAKMFLKAREKHMIEKYGKEVMKGI